MKTEYYLRLKSAKMSKSQYLPIVVDEYKLKEKLQKYEELGYTVSHIKPKNVPDNMGVL